MNLCEAINLNDVRENIKGMFKKSISYTKSNLSPIKIFYRFMDICISLMRSLRIYKVIYNISLVLINVVNKKKFLKFYSRFVKKDDLCFDIGANFGWRTEIFLKLGATVVAVEPQDYCMQELQKKYGNNKKVILIKKAISDNLGEEELMVSDSHTLSSMSKEWIDSIKSSDMFFVSTQAFRWQKIAKVQVTTLDQLIKDYGKPSFCKIDVEGYEYKVLKSLSEPIKGFSFEFTPTQQFIVSALDTVKHLANIGEVKFNYSIGESISLVLKEWVGPDEISNILPNLLNKTHISGDIYARFIS
ncbi:MAG: FkbM family methyltransferase [Candidatus Humimicrobiaceae bacterium]